MSSASGANSSLLVVETLQQSWRRRRRRRRRPNFGRRKDEHVGVVVRATKRETQNQNEGGEAALLDQTSNNGGAKDDEGTETGSLRRQSSTEDMFALYCEKHVELVANALGNDAKCMLYLTEERSGGGLRLAQVASFPSTTSYEGADEEDNNINDNDNNSNNIGNSMNRGGRPSSSNRGVNSINNSFDWSVVSEQDEMSSTKDANEFDNVDSSNKEVFELSTSLVPPSFSRSNGPDAWASANDETTITAETLLLNKEYFFLPSTNAMVFPLTLEGLLIGLLVGELPLPDIKMSSSSSRSSGRKGKGKNRSKRRMNLNQNVDREEQFGERERQCLKNGAEAFVPVWTMQKRALLLMKKTYVQEQNVGDYLYDSRVPLSALRTMTGMLKTYLKSDEESPAGDMADAIMAQGDILATLSQQLEDALYPHQGISPFSASLNPTSDDQSSPSSPSAESKISNSDSNIGKALNQPPKSASQKIFLPSSSRSRKPVAKCDVASIVAALLATSELIANSAGVSMIASLPTEEERDGVKECSTCVSINENVTRSVIARMIDSALVMAPSEGRIDVAVRPQTLEIDNSMRLGVLVAVRVTDVENRLRDTVIIPEDDQSLRIAADTIHQAGGVMRTVETKGQEIASIQLWLPSF
tara:strand:+ start:1381 stop:3309 length:1929 start_codon:yes stop_codon:yes gene_type:complete